MADTRDNIDDFWDISKLIPKKKSNIPSFSTHTPVSDVVVESKTEEEALERVREVVESLK